MRAPLLTLVLSGALVFAACSGDDDDDAAAKNPDPTTPAVVSPDLALTRGEVAVASAGIDIVLDEASAQAVIDAAQQYVEVATVAPMMTGKVGAGYDKLFDAGVAAAAADADRAALTDQGMPRAVASPTLTASPIRIDGLADKDGTVVLLAATFDVDVSAKSADGNLSLHRTNELTYAPVDGGWKITAYKVTVERDLPGAEPTTTTAEVSP